jgi:(5-formylfuran-3-yl)methyl phosphate synthase
VAGGAAIIDVKEPRLGSLGRADFDVWQGVRASVPSHVTVTVALGELADCLSAAPIVAPPSAWSGIGFQKLGLAGAPANWVQQWRELRRRLGAALDTSPNWVAVVYTDWQAACAPAPDAVISACASADDCRGVLFDTWDKSRAGAINRKLQRWAKRVREAGRFVAVAGGLDETTIPQLAELEPDIVAVRGAACRGGDRLAAIDADRVALLAKTVCELAPAARI